MIMSKKQNHDRNSGGILINPTEFGIMFSGVTPPTIVPSDQTYAWPVVGMFESKLEASGINVILFLVVFFFLCS